MKIELFILKKLESRYCYRRNTSIAVHVAMANSLLKISFFIGYILFGMLSSPCTAVNDGQVDLLEGLIDQLVESERIRYCNLCTYICPRLFYRMQERGISSIYENKDADTRAKIEPYITPLVRYLLGEFHRVFLFFKG